MRTPSSSDHPNVKIVVDAVKEYNNYSLEGYGSYFSKNVNLVHTNGLGNTRIANGIQQFKNFNKNYFSKKIGNIKILDNFYSEPWVMTHQLVTLGSSVLESTVGYRIEDGKIADILIIGERKIN